MKVISPIDNIKFLRNHAILYFKMFGNIRSKIDSELKRRYFLTAENNKRYILTAENYDCYTKEIYSIVLNKFVDNEIERLKDCREDIIEFNLNDDSLTKLINNAIESLVTNDDKSDVQPESNIADNSKWDYQRIKDRVNKIKKANPNKTMEKIFSIVSKETGKTIKSIDRLFYYKPKN